jgi:hypothetical protein
MEHWMDANRVFPLTGSGRTDKTMIGLNFWYEMHPIGYACDGTLCDLIDHIMSRFGTGNLWDSLLDMEPEIDIFTP